MTIDTTPPSTVENIHCVFRMVERYVEQSLYDTHDDIIGASLLLGTAWHAGGNEALMKWGALRDEGYDPMQIFELWWGMPHALHDYRTRIALRLFQERCKNVYWFTEAEIGDGDPANKRPALLSYCIHEADQDALAVWSWDGTPV